MEMSSRQNATVTEHIAKMISTKLSVRGNKIDKNNILVNYV